MNLNKISVSFKTLYKLLNILKKYVTVSSVYERIEHLYTTFSLDCKSLCFYLVYYNETLSIFQIQVLG